VWNTLRPAGIRDHEHERHAVAEQTFAWVHVDDLVTLLADLATGRIASADDPAFGPVVGACTPVNVAASPATVRDYYETVTKAVGVDPVWDDRPAWTGRLVADRARVWGWSPAVTLEQALDELDRGLRDA
jgi:nucleoside-diphosphate-sugar epimerase